MEVVVCPACGTRVIVSAEGVCPACRTACLVSASEEAITATVEPETPTDSHAPAGGAIDYADLEVDSTEPELPADLAEPAEPADRAPAPMTFGAAVGWCLAVLMFELMAGCVVGAIFGGTGMLQAALENGDGLIAVALALSSLIFGFVGWNNVQPEPARRLAVRRMAPLHAFVILLLVLPFSALVVEIGGRAGQTIDLLIDAPAQQSTATTSAVFAQPQPICAYTSLFDQKFEALCRLPWFVMILVGCILPGVCEEIFFRGLLGHGLVARYGILRGVALASLLFGVMHIDPAQACYTFVAGIALHLVYVWTGSLWGPVALHIALNAVAFSLHKLTIEHSILYYGADDDFVLPFPLTVAAALATTALMYVLYQTRVDGDLPGYLAEKAAPSRRPSGIAVAAPAAGCLLFALGLGYFTPQGFDMTGAYAMLHQGQEHAANKEYEKALAMYEKAIECDPQMAEAYRARGEAHRVLGNLPGALSDCNHALKLERNFAMAYADRGETYRLLERWNEAREDCQRALQLAPELAWSRSVRGMLNSDCGRSGEAIDDFETSLRLDPQQGWVYQALAWELSFSDDTTFHNLPRAIHYASKGCELTDWSNADALSMLAAVYYADGQTDKAIGRLTDAVAVAPEHQRSELEARLTEYRQPQTPLTELAP